MTMQFIHVAPEKDENIRVGVRALGFTINKQKLPRSLIY